MPGREGRTRFLGAVVLVAAFVVGGLAGAAATRVLDADPRPADRDEREHRGDRHSRESAFMHELGLDAGQQAAVDSILARRRVQMKAVWREVEPRFDGIVDSARSEIRAQLTDEQRARYDQHLQERRERRERERQEKERRGARDGAGPAGSPPAEGGGSTGGGEAG